MNRLYPDDYLLRGNIFDDGIKILEDLKQKTTIPKQEDQIQVKPKKDSSLLWVLGGIALGYILLKRR